jgi:ATP-dependent RNA helicase DeaD
MIEHLPGPGEEPGFSYVPAPNPDLDDAPAQLALVGSLSPEDAPPEDVTDEGPDDGPDDGPEDTLDASAVDEAPFAILPAPLRRALEARGFESFTPVQRAVLEAVGAGCDLRISSQTGSGKTVALGLAMAVDVLADAHVGKPGGAQPSGGAFAVARPTREQRGPVALVIVPTRELAAQVSEELTWLFAEVPGASVDVVTGGTSVPIERRRLARSPRILVGTPGRLLDHLNTNSLRLDTVRQLVLDEADQMLDMGFRDELEAILERTPTDRHTHLVSATFPEGIQRLAERYQRAARSVEGTRLGAVNADISHVAHLVRPDQRYDLLVNHLLLSGDERTLVFVNTRAETGELAARLTEDGFGAQPLSGELQQAQRTRTLAAFRAGTAPVLIATDVAARGLDVPDVALVIHTAVPIDAETYIHRSGRTGRAGQSGRSILMVAPSRERRASRMLAEAGIRLTWQPVPQAREVRQALDARSAVALAARLEAAATEAEAPTATELQLARELLLGRQAEFVVAALLRGAVPGPKTPPRSIADAPVPRTQQDPRRTGRDTRYGAPTRHGDHGRYGEPRGYGRDDSYAAAEAPRGRFRNEPDEAPPHSRDALLRGEDRRGEGARTEARPRGAEFVRFRVNWGFRGGANPRRLLATLCRRGGVTNREIGSIDIGPAFSTFEVAGYAADAFFERAGRDDPRDPGLFVSPDEGRRDAPREPMRPPRPRGPRRG